LGRIVGGKEARPGTYPFFVWIDKEGSQHCGGSLILSDVVLTAGNEATFCIDFCCDTTIFSAYQRNC
jgi:secreted trypsin-like serine protease